MVCIYCAGETKTINSRKKLRTNIIWRRRKCETCKAIFTTAERVELEMAIRIKKDSLEPFQREKLLLDLYNSLSHRKTAINDAKELSETIISQLIPNKTGILSSSDIAHTAFVVLKRFDKASATYYKAHHLNKLLG